MPLALYYADIYSDGISTSARFPRLRYRMVRQSLESQRGQIDFRSAPRLEPQQLLLAHAPEYVAAFLEDRLDEAARRRIGLLPWTELMRQRTLHLMGGSLAALHHALNHHTWSGNLGGGTHHAHRAFGSGYCVFNDLALAAQAALSAGIQKILIVDMDVHQGDGTATIFEHEPRVFTFSMHCGKNFPFRKAQSDLDVELPAGASDAEYLAALHEHLPPLFARLAPELVIYQAGVDPLADDTLGQLQLTHAGLKARNELVYALVAASRAPLLILMGGGYGRPLEATISAHADVFSQAAQWCP